MAQTLLSISIDCCFIVPRRWEELLLRLFFVSPSPLGMLEKEHVITAPVLSGLGYEA